MTSDQKSVKEEITVQQQKSYLSCEEQCKHSKLLGMLFSSKAVAKLVLDILLHNKHFLMKNNNAKAKSFLFNKA